MTTETQKTITQWADETFGMPVTDHSIAVRAMGEMVELYHKLHVDDAHPGAAEEAADIIIVLMRIFERRGVHFWDEVERKMAINRARKWQLTGDGHGQHVKSEGDDR